MDLTNNIIQFIKQKKVSYKLTLRALANKSDIPYSTINNIIQGIGGSPDIKTLLKLADFFECSIDEVLGRDEKYFLKKSKHNYFRNMEITQVTENMKTFITKKSVAHKIALSRLSLNIGFNRDLLANFVQNNPRIKRLGSKPMLAIANYFDISIDEMIGRSSSILRMDEDPENNSN